MGFVDLTVSKPVCSLGVCRLCGFLDIISFSLNQSLNLFSTISLKPFKLNSSVGLTYSLSEISPAKLVIWNPIPVGWVLWGRVSSDASDVYPGLSPTSLAADTINHFRTAKICRHDAPTQFHWVSFQHCNGAWWMYLDDKAYSPLLPLACECGHVLTPYWLRYASGNSPMQTGLG